LSQVAPGFRRTFVFAFLVALSGALTPPAVSAPAPSAEKPKPLAEQMPGLQFRSIGPFRGGRVTAVAGVVGKPMTFFFGGTGGGVFRTVDGGASWEPVSDKDFRTGSVGAIGVAGSDANVVYAGMGEACIRATSRTATASGSRRTAGRAGRTSASRRRARSRPSSSIRRTRRRLGRGARARLGPNAERGIFKSSDGGTTWRKVLYVDEKTGGSDLSIDPSNPRVLYAGLWQVGRKPWLLESGGPGSGLWKSTDGGETWKKLAGGLPEGLVGRIGVSVSPARPERVYAMVEAEKGGLYRTDDGGEKWTRVNDENKLRQRAWYYSHVVADPKNADAVYVLNVQFHRSGDGGKTFAAIRTPHSDNHALWIDPDDPNRMIEGNDGGAAVSFDGGRSWSPS